MTRWFWVYAKPGEGVSKFMSCMAKASWRTAFLREAISTKRKRLISASSKGIKIGTHVPRKIFCPASLSKKASVLSSELNWFPKKKNGVLQNFCRKLEYSKNISAKSRKKFLCSTVLPLDFIEKSEKNSWNWKGFSRMLIATLFLMIQFLCFAEDEAGKQLPLLVYIALQTWFVTETARCRDKTNNAKNEKERQKRAPSSPRDYF